MLESNIKLKLFSLSFPLELAMLTLNSDRPVVQSKPGYLIYSASATSAPDIMMHWARHQPKIVAVLYF